MSRQLAGLKAKKAGESFEEIFKAMCNREAIVCVDFPDGCSKVSTPYGLKLYAKEMPFDFMICKQGKAAAIDCKSTAENTFQYSSIVPHQLRSLVEVGSQIPAGYVVYFREKESVVFFDHKTLQGLRPQTSLKIENGILLGQIGNCNIQRILDHETNATFQTNLF